MRSNDSHFIDNTINRNPYIWIALFLCVGLLLMAVYIPEMARVLQIVPPDLNGWITVLVMSLLPFAFGQLRKILIF